MDGEKYYYLYNGHADATVLVDASTGLVAASHYYDAFGNILEETGAVSSPILYAGYQYDEEAGLYYLNARMYDPKIARFLQEDTYRGDRNDPLSLHLYAYCFNNPLRYFDPTGHMGVAVRAAEEAAGNKIAWKAGTKSGLSTIIVTRSDGSTETLHEGVDYEIGKDGRAYYVVRDEPSTGGSAGYVGQRKDTGAIAGAPDGDIAPRDLDQIQYQSELRFQVSSVSSERIEITMDDVVEATDKFLHSIPITNYLDAALGINIITGEPLTGAQRKERLETAIQQGLDAVASCYMMGGIKEVGGSTASLGVTNPLPENGIYARAMPREFANQLANGTGTLSGGPEHGLLLQMTC